MSGRSLVEKALRDEKEYDDEMSKLKAEVDGYKENVRCYRDQVSGLFDTIDRLTRQRDYAVNALESMVETVHPIHPANKWAEVALEKIQALSEPSAAGKKGKP
jgi:predicted  nucleic acid-binding Zn-ribbon protein